MNRKKSLDKDKPLSIEQAQQKLQKGLTDYLAGNDLGPIVFRLTPTKKRGELYPLKLTWHQRDSLVHYTRIKNKIKERLQQAGEGTQIVGVTRKELDHLNDEIGQASLYAAHPHTKRLVAVLHKVAELFASDRAGLFGEETSKTRKTAPKTRKTAPKKDNLLYQFKITLLDIKLPIWRRIQIPDCTLADLHEYIQAAFGWDNYHLHQFEIDGERYSQPAPDGDDFGLEFEDETDEPAHQKIAAGLGAMPIIWPLLPTRSMNNTRNCWNGGGRLIPKPSTRSRRRWR